MNKTIAKHQNCRKVHQLQMKTKVVGPRGLYLICLHHSLPLAPFFEMKADSFELVYDTHLDHSILDVKFGLGREGFSDLTNWPLTQDYDARAKEKSKDFFKCSDYVSRLSRHPIIY